ncbi:MAG TPA: NAD-dependent epimerase/dehydratase family protein [Solirubrobacteraceae bacterium]|nr:NAD-dependent epimerase/dehydratase family protein [Solirubrobacteraceae bacterium]
MELNGTRVAVTGAGGFIGRATCARLVAGGAIVTGLDVAPGARAAVEATGAAFALCDTTDPVAVARGLEGVAGVIHTAAILGDRGGMDEQVRVNVGGTRNVLDGAAAAGAQRVVHLSSVATWGYDFTWALASEAAPPRVCGAPYVDTKTASHELALARGAAVVRPGDVYGPGSVPWTLRPIEAIRAGTFVLPGHGEGVLTLVYIDDLVDCVVLALTVPQAGGQAVTAWDGVPVTAKAYFDRYARMLGKGEVRCAPEPVLRAAAGVLELRARVTGRPADVTREAIRYITRHAVYPNDRARDLLGWEPQVDLDEGLRRTEDWLRAERLI